ncbi:972_t:CDS:2, partial [Funneliformis geosporum]
MPRKQCQECKEIKNMSELSAKLEICQSCRTCENCSRVINDGTLYYTLDESYKEKLTRCHFCLSKGDRHRQLRHYDLDRLLREARQVENKLKNFKEGQDYSIVPTDEPNVKTYNFHNDKLRSAFRGDKVPVRVTQEAYDGQDYTYRGHFEEGKDYRYTRSIFAGRQEGISEHSKVEVYGEGGKFNSGKMLKKMRLIEENGGKGSEYLRQKYGENYFISPDRNKIIESIKQSINEYETKIQFDKAKEYYGVYSLDRSGQEVYCSSDCAEKYKSDPYGIIEYLPQTYLGKDDNNHSDLRQENQALRQQLSEVQKQLAKVLKELKKLKKEVKGEESEKLSQQIVQNERLMQESKHVSVAEVQEQVNKSQALMKELKNVSSTNNNKEGSMVPYVIGGS